MANSPGQIVAAELRAEMARQCKTQVQLAAALGHNEDWWSKRLLGKLPLGIDDLVAICDWLGLDSAALLPRVVAA